MAVRNKRKKAKAPARGRLAVMRAKAPKTKPRSWYMKQADAVFSRWIRDRDYPNGR